jgi:Tfp pilus assembly protein PilV
VRPTARDKRSFRSRLRAERGSMLIEVMVGAVILAIATTAILNGIDGAQGTGTRNKARSVAAALAEQDQERMRALPVLSLAKSLAGRSATRPVTVRGVDYTVTSKASWVTDEGGVVSCSSNAKAAANLRIVSEVTSPGTRGVVDEVSLLSPPPGTYAEGEGTVAVQLIDRDSVGIEGVPVNLSGTGSFSAVTNDLGCAVFPFIPIGQYTATLATTGLVDFDGRSPVTGDTSATQGVTTLLPLQVDEPATVNVSFNTVVVVGSTSHTRAAKAQYATVSNSKLSSPSYKVFPDTATSAPKTVVPATRLYPFLDGYGFYAGQCTANLPPSVPNTGALTPGGSKGVTARVPSINVRVTDGNGTNAVNAATVKIKSDDGCPTSYASQYQTSAAVTYGSTTLQGALPEPGFPYGRYKLCAEKANFPTTGVTRHGHADVRPFANSGHVDEQVPNTAANGNTTNFNTNGAIRLRLNQNGPCEW